MRLSSLAPAVLALRSASAAPPAQSISVIFPTIVKTVTSSATVTAATLIVKSTATVTVTAPPLKNPIFSNEMLQVFEHNRIAFFQGDISALKLPKHWAKDHKIQLVNFTREAHEVKLTNGGDQYYEDLNLSGMESSSKNDNLDSSKLRLDYSLPDHFILGAGFTERQPLSLNPGVFENFYNSFMPDHPVNMSKYNLDFIDGEQDFKDRANRFLRTLEDWADNNFIDLGIIFPNDNYTKMDFRNASMGCRYKYMDDMDGERLTHLNLTCACGVLTPGEFKIALQPNQRYNFHDDFAYDEESKYDETNSFIGFSHRLEKSIQTQMITHLDPIPKITNANPFVNYTVHPDVVTNVKSALLYCKMEPEEAANKEEFESFVDDIHLKIWQGDNLLFIPKNLLIDEDKIKYEEPKKSGAPSIGNVIGVASSVAVMAVVFSILLV